MHDPSTVAWEIRAPWKTGTGTWRYRPSIITIWHEDPESDGSDDSCRWSSPKLTKEQLAKLKKVATWELDRSYGMWEAVSDGRKQKYICKLDPFAAAYNIFEKVSWELCGKRISYKELRDVLNLCTNHDDSFYRNFSGMQEQYDIERTFFFIGRAILSMRRPWWKHPRYHVHHWSIQVHAIQRLKRFLFSRCCKCGGRFKYGEAPISSGWGGGGPRWFRNEPGVHHSACQDWRNMGAETPASSIKAT